MKHLMKLFLGVSMAALMPAPALGQVPTGRIEGTVQDSSGAVIPGARLSLVNERTQARLHAEAGGEGFYVFASLQPSIYTLTVEAQGFKSAIINGIELNVGINNQVVTLEVGQVTESIAVAANAIRVQTTDATVQRAITLRDIDTLPQVSRSPIFNTLYQPGIQTSGRVNGQRLGSNNNTLDGIDVNDSVFPSPGTVVASNNTDSVEEIRIVTSGGKAEFGRNSGGQVELVTRSGTNRFHGNLFDYLRNTVLNANTFFSNISGQARPKFIQNQFGGSLGGPVIIPKLYNGREKIFFFFNYQGVRSAQEVVRNRTVFTPEAKSGIFRWRVPGSNELRSFNVIQNDPRGKGIDPIAAQQINLLPPPNNFDIGDTLNTAGFRFNNPAPSRNKATTAKIDYHVTGSHRIWYRQSVSDSYSNTPGNNADATYPGQPSGSLIVLSKGFAAGSNWTITPRLVNEFVAGHTEGDLYFTRPRPQGPLALPNLFSEVVQSGFGDRRNSPVNQFSDNLSILRGRHSFKTGARISRTTEFQSSNTSIWPALVLSRTNGNIASSIGPTGAAVISAADRQRFESYYNDMLGRVGLIRTNFYSDLQTFQPAGTPRVRNFKYNDYAFFFQDDWRVRKNLTVNLGLRYEFYGVPDERDGLQGTVVQAASINPVSNIRDVTVRKGSQWFANDRNNFAPRVGIAWDPRGDGRTSLRASWGVYYDRLAGITTRDPDGAMPGFAFTGQVFPNQAAGSDVRLSDGPVLPAPPGSPALTPDANRTNMLSIFDPNFRTPYVMQMNFTGQRELLRGTVLEAGYVGSRGVKLLADINMNQFKTPGAFLTGFNQIAAFRRNATAVPADNVFVRLFGSPAAAVAAAGGTVFDQGAIGTAANTIDTLNFTRYPAAGLSDFFLRNYPQFGTLPVATNGGRSSYDSLQLSLRRQAGAVRFSTNYTWSKSLDNISVDGQGFTSPIDNFNLRLNKGHSDSYRAHILNWTGSYFLPFGKGRAYGGAAPGWLDRIIGGWEIGTLGFWASGLPMTVSSGVATVAANIDSRADYSGSRRIGAVQRAGNGVTYFTPEQLRNFTVPAAGEIGDSGRNTFRGPRFFNIDTSLIKRFRIHEQHAITFRAEMYNMLNNVNFSLPGINLQTPQTFGRISAFNGSPRVVMLALRYDF